MNPDPTPPATTFTHPHYPYSPAPSIASSASSSNSSVWSVASVSSNATSVASSATTDGLTVPNTAIIPLLPPRNNTWQPKKIFSTGIQANNGLRHPHPPPPIAIPEEALPIEQRQNPRRTNRLLEGVSAGCPVSEACPLPPVPTLQRQADRKVNFVDNLVDSAAQIVETIWPPPRFIGCSATPKDKVLPLRTFIQETLRRSRTSYSTLQVALYYLIVIRPHLPPRGCDINSLPPDEAQMTRAKQCGRRMFLAALILASKYLQDRNYSARAWSKISGLNTQEININEMAFLDAVNWKLHISETNFQKWTDLVLKYTSDHTPSPISPIRPSSWTDEEERKKEWCELILTLTPDLIEVELTPPGGLKPCSEEVATSSLLDMDPLVRATSILPQIPVTKSNVAQLEHALPASLPPRTLEPQPRNCHAFNALHQPLPKSGLNIPPPSFHRSGSSTQLSPGHITPAVGLKSGNYLPMSTPVTGSSMASVARVAHNNMISECAQENWSFISRRGPAGVQPVAAVPPPSHGRRSSLSLCMMKPGSPASSSLSSPSTQFSRSSPGCPISSRQSPMFPFKRQNSDLSRLTAGNGSGHFQTPTQSPSTAVPPFNAFSKKVGSPGRLNEYRHMTPYASPKSREAALSLNMLKENYSPCSTGSTTPTSFPPLSRKRSYVASSLESNRPSNVLKMEVSTNGYSVDGHTSVTPKFKSLKGFGSPTLSPNLDRSKRLRCAVVGGNIGMMEGMSVAQNVR